MKLNFLRRQEEWKYHQRHLKEFLTTSETDSQKKLLYSTNSTPPTLQTHKHSHQKSSRPPCSHSTSTQQGMFSDGLTNNLSGYLLPPTIAGLQICAKIITCLYYLLTQPHKIHLNQWYFHSLIGPQQESNCGAPDMKIRRYHCTNANDENDRIFSIFALISATSSLWVWFNWLRF